LKNKKKNSQIIKEQELKKATPLTPKATIIPLDQLPTIGKRN